MRVAELRGKAAFALPSFDIDHEVNQNNRQNNPFNQSSRAHNLLSPEQQHIDEETENNGNTERCFRIPKWLKFSAYFLSGVTMSEIIIGIVKQLSCDVSSTLLRNQECDGFFHSASTTSNNKYITHEQACIFLKAMYPDKHCSDLLNGNFVAHHANDQSDKHSDHSEYFTKAEGGEDMDDRATYHMLSQLFPDTNLDDWSSITDAETISNDAQNYDSY